MNAVWGVFFTILLILYMGLRPVSVIFGDTVNYASKFLKYNVLLNPLSGHGKQTGCFITCMPGLPSIAISILSF